MAGNLFVRRDVWRLEDPNPFDPITLAYAGQRLLVGLSSLSLYSGLWAGREHGPHRARAMMMGRNAPSAL